MISYLIFTNILLIGQDIVMFTGINKIDGSLYLLNNFRTSDIQSYEFLLIPQAWSIGLELMFYIIAPFIVRKSIRHIILFILASILLRAFIYFYIGWSHDPWTYRFFPTELALFLFGSIAYKIYNNINIKDIKKDYLILLVCLYFFIIIFYQFIPILSHIKNWLIYLMSIWMIPILFSLTKNNKIDNFIGELSYPIYLVHMLAIGISSKFISSQFSTITTILISIFSAILMVRFIEEPIDKLRQKRVKKTSTKRSALKNT